MDNKTLNPFETWIVALNVKLNSIDARLDNVENWKQRLDLIEAKIEIKERLRKIEEVLAK